MRSGRFYSDAGDQRRDQCRPDAGKLIEPPAHDPAVEFQDLDLQHP
jgi:hypothetical protein